MAISHNTYYASSESSKINGLEDTPQLQSNADIDGAVNLDTVNLKTEAFPFSYILFLGDWTQHAATALNDWCETHLRQPYLLWNAGDYSVHEQPEDQFPDEPWCEIALSDATEAALFRQHWDSDIAHEASDGEV